VRQSEGSPVPLHASIADRGPRRRPGDGPGRPGVGYAAGVIVVGTVSPGRATASEALEVARLAAGGGARVEIVGVVPGDADGDRLLLELAAVGVGHATVTRTATEPEAADLELALRYLPDVRAVVVVGPEPVLLPTLAAAASWSGASLVIVDAAAPAERLAVEPIVLAPPPRDPDGTFAGFVAALAVRLDAGSSDREAWDQTVASLAADRVASAPARR
jgi:hypothetical protein